MICEHIAPICLHRIEPTRFAAHTLARCQIMIEFLGVTLTTAMRRFMHIHNFGLPSIDVASDASSSLLSELVRTRRAMKQMKDLAQRGMTSLITDSMGASFVASGGTILQTSKRQAKSDRVGHIVHAMATYATKLNIAFKHTPNSLAQAARVLHVARRGTDASPDEADRALRDLVGIVQCGHTCPTSTLPSTSTRQTGSQRLKHPFGRITNSDFNLVLSVVFLHPMIR